jgi:hypothetical protein
VRRNRPSSSALKVAHAVAFLQPRPGGGALLPPASPQPNERLLARSGTPATSPGQRRREPALRRLFYLLDSLGRPGQLLFVGLRKRLVADEAAAASPPAAGSCWSSAAGLDTLALRLAQEHPH